MSEEIGLVEQVRVPYISKVTEDLKSALSAIHLS
jgi:hypothetical protein